jgi:hypothetical protein
VEREQIVGPSAGNFHAGTNNALRESSIVQHVPEAERPENALHELAVTGRIIVAVGANSRVGRRNCRGGNVDEIEPF